MSDDAAAPMRGVEVAELLITDHALRGRLLTYAAKTFRLDRATAEDLLNDTMIDLLRTEELIKRPDGFAFIVFRSRCCRHLERVVERRELSSKVPVPSIVRDDRESLPMKLTLHQGLERISPTCRRLLKAHYGEGRSLKETAEELALAYSGLSTLITRCVRKLKALCGP